MRVEALPSDFRHGLEGRFGQDGAPQWSGPDDADPVRRAARVQDQVARFVNITRKASGESQKDLSHRVGMDAPRLSRILTGAVWANLVELEVLLGACGTTLTSVALAVGDGSHQSPRVKRIIASYLHEMLAKVEAEIPHTEPVHPSTANPLPQEGPA